ncbi:MAG: amidohydrolase family protein [Cocleimonas sp.]|nr:amidohydrolase family protein [Cocleimonas sp.]
MKTTAFFLITSLLTFAVHATEIVLKGATIFPSPETETITSGDIAIKNGVITSVGTDKNINNAEFIDLSGKFVTAGFWNTHVHYLFESKDTLPENKAKLESLLSDMFLKWGFVNTVDTGSDPAILSSIDSAIESGDLIGPKIYQIGGGFVPEGGSPFYIAPMQLPEFTSAGQAKELARSALSSGMDGIKMFTGSWSTPETIVLMNPEHVKVAVDEAHEFGKLAFAHPSDSDGALIAIDSGVDVLAHAFPAELKGPWDKTLPAKMKQAGTALIPTLKLFRHDLQRLGLPAFIVDRLEQNAIDQVAAAHSEGCQILFGTDVGYMEDDDTTQEFYLLEKAGLKFNDILGSLTTEPSKLFKVSNDQGIVSEGFQANLVVLNSDPRVDVKAFSDIHMVIKKGMIIYRKKL